MKVKLTLTKFDVDQFDGIIPYEDKEIIVEMTESDYEQLRNSLLLEQFELTEINNQL